jgi:hypothetical protein
MISKQENAHPEAALLVAGDINAGKLKCHVQPEVEKLPPLLHTQRWIQSSTPPSHLANLTIILSFGLQTKTKAGSTSDSLNTEVVR